MRVRTDYLQEAVAYRQSGFAYYTVQKLPGDVQNVAFDDAVGQGKSAYSILHHGQTALGEVLVELATAIQGCGSAKEYSGDMERAVGGYLQQVIVQGRESAGVAGEARLYLQASCAEEDAELRAVPLCGCGAATARENDEQE